MLMNTHNAAHTKKNQYKPLAVLEFFPDYLHERDREKEVTKKSIEEQNAEFDTFRSMYLVAENRARGK